MTTANRTYTSVELCAGAGGQALGLHQAGFAHLALVEMDKAACSTLRHNVSEQGWEHCVVLEHDLHGLDPAALGVEPGSLDLLAGGVPCPPFSSAGKRLGQEDERDLFPRFLHFVEALRPRAVMIENVRGLLSDKFAGYRVFIAEQLQGLGYEICAWDVLEARSFGVPQLRPRAILVAMRREEARFYEGLPVGAEDTVTVFDALQNSMAKRAAALRQHYAGHPQALARVDQAYANWVETATAAGGVAPTLVGGSKKHGGADLGPTRAKRAWRTFGVNPLSLADADPTGPKELDNFTDQSGVKLTVEQAAIIQGLPSSWVITGGKTHAYRQVGNAFPPPVAKAVGETILRALKAADSRDRRLPVPTATIRLPIQASSRPTQPALPGF